MFDIGFTELLLISIVALLVLGPDKLPQAARVTALWVGRARRSFNKVKSEIEEQLDADEIRRQLHNESIMADLDEAKKKARKIGDDTRRSFEKVDEDVRNTIHDGALRDGILRKGNEPASSGDSPDKEQETSSGEHQESDSQAGGKDEDNREQDTGGEQKESSATEEDAGKQEPVTDFYNNPGGRIVSLKGGNFASAEHPDDARDEEKREGQQDNSGEQEDGQTGSRHDDKE